MMTNHISLLKEIPFPFADMDDLSNICTIHENKLLHYSYAVCCQCCQTLQWRHNGRDSVSNHQPRECLLSRLIKHRSKKISKLRVTGLCAGNSHETGEFPAQRASNAWRPLGPGQAQEGLPKWIMPFRRTIRVRRGKSVRFIDSQDSTKNVCGLSADSPRKVLGFNREWRGMPRNVRIVARQCGHI